MTREALKREHPSPWGDLFAWQTADRAEAWQVWRSMKADGPTVPKAPCQVACPAGTDAGRYVGLIGAGRYDEAYAVAAEVNPFPSVCGWICTAPCETVCRRGVLDEPIAIRTLKRFAAEHGSLPPVEPPAVKRTEKVGIVGGGPAGMSAAYYLARLGYPVTVFEAMPVPGGMMAIGIPSYRLPRDVLQAEIARIVGLGVDLRLDTAMGRDFTLGDLESQGYRAVFLATGASKSRRLGVPGDDAPGVVPATLFLKRVNLGEEPRLSGPAVVVGGGSTAMDAARSAWRSGASPVTVVYRRGRAEMPAQVEEIEAAEREGIVVRTGLAPVEVVGRDGAVVGLRCIETRAAPGAARRPATARTLGAGPGHRGGTPGRDDPRRRRRGARSVDPARGRRDRGQRLGRHRRRSADARDRPGRHLRRWRRRVRAEDDHRRRRLGPPRRRVHPRVPERRRRRRGRRSSRPVRYRDRARGRRSPSTWPAGPGRTRRCRWSSPARSRPPRSGSTRPPPGRRPPAASAATRSTPARPSTSAPVADRTSRPRSPTQPPGTHDIAGGTR